MVAMSYAAQFPDHPAKLILSSTAARLRLDETYRMMEERGGEEARTIAERFWTDPDEAVMMDYIRVCMPLYNPKPNPAEVAARKRATLRPEVSRHFILGEMRTMNMLEDVGKIRCPTLILAGGYDPITPVACSEEIAAALPSGLGDLQIFPEAGHGVHRDQPERAEEIMRGFLSGTGA